MVENLVGWEKELFLLLNAPHTPYLDGVMYLISQAIPWVVFLLPFLFFLAHKQDRREFFLLLLFIILLVFLADGFSSGIIKPIFQRARPTHHPVTEEVVKTVLGYRGGNYGFISGHSTNFLAFAMFSSLIFRNKLYTFIAFLSTLTVAYSRIYLGVHFITDVVPGILVGILIGWVVYILYVEARVSFFSMSRKEAQKPYVSDDSIRHITLLLGGFYLAVWMTAPLFIRFYA